MPVDLLAAEIPKQGPVDLLAVSDNAPSWRSAAPQGVWERIKSIFPDDSATEGAKVKNALVYSEMLGIRPSQAYEYHDEISEQFKNKTAGQKIATKQQGIGGTLQSSWESSLAGMMVNQKVTQPFESVSQAESFIHGMVTMGLDLPFFMGGYVLGGGNPVSGMAGGFGFTAGLRQVLMDRYAKGEMKTPKEFFDRLGNAARETVKGQVVGGFTGGARVLAGPAFKALAPGLETPAAWTMLSEISAMTAAGKLIEGQIPTAKDFIDNAAALLVIHAGTRGYETSRARLAEVRDKLKTSYVESGAPPQVIVRAIAAERYNPKEDVITTIDRVNQELKAEFPEAKEGTGKEPPPAEIVQPGADLTTGAKNTLPRDEFFVKVSSGSDPIYVIKNPSQADYYEMSQAFRKQYPNVGDMPYARTTQDAAGNTYMWRSDEAIHGQIEPILERKFGTGVTQNFPSGPKVSTLPETEGKPVPPSVLKDYPELAKQIPKPQPAGQTSIKNATVDAERAARGAAPIETPLSALSKDWRKQVEAKIDAGEIRPEEIARKVNNLVDAGEQIPGEYTTDEVNHALLYDKKRLQNEYKEASPERQAEIERRLDENEYATKAIGTEQGRALQSRQAEMAEDYSIPAMIRRAREDGVPITPEIREKYTKLGKKIERADNDLEAFRKRKEAQIAEYERRINEKDFSAIRTKKELELGEEELKLQYKLDALKKEYVKEKTNDYLRQRNLPTIIKDDIIESMNLVRAIKSAFDVSAPGRQGFFALISHPIKGFKNIPEMFRALGSDEAAYRIEQSIQGRPNFKLYKEGGLSLTEAEGGSKNVEEIYRSRWGEAIPGIPASNRAFTSFLNLMRADLFDTMHKSAFSDRAATKGELQAIADYVNIATGRGTLKGYENALHGLGTFLWAPKLVLSRFQMLLGKGLMPGGGRTAATRKAVAKEYARILGGLATIYAVSDILGFTVEDDPRSSDFGKIIVGNTRVDILAGVSQCSVLIGRLYHGEKKSIKTGRVTPIRGDYIPYGGTDTWGVLSNFLRTKLTPVIGEAITIYSGKDITGAKVDLYDVPSELVVPLAVMDIYDAMDEEGIPSGLALGTLGMFGIGIQTHEEKGARR